MLVAVSFEINIVRKWLTRLLIRLGIFFIRYTKFQEEFHLNLYNATDLSVRALNKAVMPLVLSFRVPCSTGTLLFWLADVTTFRP
jgi:hypothetical protein